MSFISYAQNFEDVMIWRALKHVENGFYIDVGANDPTLYSVTRAFYDKGWHGINVEPVSEFFERLEAQRPRDINLKIGAGECAGSFAFFDIPDTGLATSEAAVAQKHRDAGWVVNTIEIPVLPLSEICRSHVQGEIHFLKVDVEGAEKSVLLGMDFQKWRPWLVIVEATVPLSQETAHAGWEGILTGAGYEFVYFDGLNRYYLASEHIDLKPAFATPPNVFDGFVLNVDQEARIRIAEAEAIARSSRQRALDAEYKTAQAVAHAEWAEGVARDQQVRAEAAWTQAVDAQEKVVAAEAAVAAERTRADAAERWGNELLESLRAVYASTSWRVTRPLRLLKRVAGFGGIRLASLRVQPLRAAVRRVAASTIRWATRQPLLHELATRILRRHPSLRSALARVSREAPAGQCVAPPSRVLAETHLSVATRRVAADIKRAIANDSP